MTKRLKAKYKINRSLGVNLWGRPKSSFNRREYGPGQHGIRRSKPTDYALQLRAKQKLRFYYGNITEKQFRNYYRKAINIKGDTSENLIVLLERRLDTIIYRAKIVPTVFAARQFINHGHIFVNGKRVNIPSYVVDTDDVLTIKPKSEEIPLVLESLNLTERDIPEYISIDQKKLVIKLVRFPSFDEVPYPVLMEPNLVIEYYSR